MFSRTNKCMRELGKHIRSCYMSTSNTEISNATILSESQPLTETGVLVSCIPDHSMSNIVAHYQTVLDTIQISSSLPWWGVLIGSGVLIRISLLPFNILYEKKMMKNVPHKIALMKLATEINSARMKGDHVLCLTKLEEKSYYKKKNKFNWRKSENMFLLPSMSVLFINFLSIRGLTELPYEPLFNSSFLWISNLCKTDPYYILPSLNALATVYVLKTGVDSGENIISKLLSSNKNLFILFAIMGSCQSLFPSALVLYWFASNLAGLMMIRPILTSNQSRKFVGLVSVEEKKEILKSFQPVSSFSEDVTESYKETRESGHNNDMQKREEKLAELEKRAIDSEQKIEELKMLLKNSKRDLDNRDLAVLERELEQSLKETEISLQGNKRDLERLRKKTFD